MQEREADAHSGGPYLDGPPTAARTVRGRRRVELCRVQPPSATLKTGKKTQHRNLSFSKARRVVHLAKLGR
eukprot:SAG22_NODE_12949_length_423_cov_249.731481_1_plen_70_part_10